MALLLVSQVNLVMRPVTPPIKTRNPPRPFPTIPMEIKIRADGRDPVLLLRARATAPPNKDIKTYSNEAGCSAG